jgi:hypothetical protein
MMALLFFSLYHGTSVDFCLSWLEMRVSNRISETMAFIPSEQDDANTYPGIVQGTVRQNTPIGDMLTLSDEKFNKFFSSFDDDKLLALEAMRGRYQERRRGIKRTV